MDTMIGNFGIILHAHLPFYGGNDLGNDVGNDLEGQRWLYECMAECYIPLIKRLEKLNKDKIDYGLTLSFTTILLEQLRNKRTRKKFNEYVNKQIERSKEGMNSDNEQKAKLADRYVKIYQEVLDYYNKINGDIIGKLKEIKKQNPRIEIGTSSLTHAYFPLYKIYSENQVKIQVGTAIKLFTKWFDFKPDFFWLPEGGYYPGVDYLLAEHNIKYTVLDPNSILLSRRQIFNLHHFESGVKLSSVDITPQKLLWGDKMKSFGYNPIYRDFHTLDRKTKLKYWKMGTDMHHKAYYIPEDAQKGIPKNCNKLGVTLQELFNLYPDYPEVINPDKPYSVVLIDMEYFGHWWAEGIDFLEQMMRQFEKSSVKVSSIKEIFEDRKTIEIVINKACSWDTNHEQWISEKTEQYNDAIRELTKEVEIIIKHPNNEKLAKMIYIEYLLAGSSDWAFEVNVERADRYGKYRLELHIQRLRYLINKYYKDEDIDITNMKEIDWLFEDIELKELIE